MYTDFIIFNLQKSAVPLADQRYPRSIYTGLFRTYLNLKSITQSPPEFLRCGRLALAHTYFEAK